MVGEERKGTGGRKGAGGLCTMHGSQQIGVDEGNFGEGDVSGPLGSRSFTGVQN